MWARRRDRSTRTVEVYGDEAVYRFVCSGLTEYARAAGLFVKEPGTVRWIRDTVRPGDVFYDVGANIGIFTIIAARRVGPTGHVVAFEPHAANFAALIGNIAANALGDHVTVVNAAVHRSSGFHDFNYASLDVGSSRSQLMGNRVPGESPFATVARELKCSVAIDQLIADGLMPRPTHIKIDVDGNEPAIVAGMAGLLSSDGRPRSVSIEVNAADEARFERQLGLYGYRLASTNVTRTGAKRKRRSRWTADDRYNAIFEATAPIVAGE